MLDGIVFVVLGLLFDILGILILSKPLLRIVYRNEEGWNARVQQSKDEYEKEKKSWEGRKEGEIKATDWIPMGIDFTRLEAYVYSVFNNFMLEKTEQRGLAFIGLSVITMGFIFQIVGNILQSLQ